MNLRRFIQALARRFPLPNILWFSTLEVQEYPTVTAPKFFYHSEEDYDSQYNISVDLSPGKGLIDVCRRNGIHAGADILEIGAGTGSLSVGLFQDNFFSTVYVSDSSPAFLKITEKKLKTIPDTLNRCKFLVLDAEKMNYLPRTLVSVIAIRAVLHHIWDLDSFFRFTARTLKRGGILIAQEPCRDGYLIMGLFGVFLKNILNGLETSLSDKEVNQIDLFIDSMKFYCRQDIDKSAGEDKHVFQVDRLGRLAEKYNLKLDFYPNQSLESFGNSSLPAEHDGYVVTFFIDYLKYCMQFDEKLIEKIKPHMQAISGFFDGIKGNQGIPYFEGIFVFRKI